MYIIWATWWGVGLDGLSGLFQLYDYNKQIELDLLEQEGEYDWISITEGWWNAIRDWMLVTGQYELLERNKLNRKGERMCTSARECIA